jgi:predicted O-linked N-acetylglucosamine transferase (SPINDLY family)
MQEPDLAALLAAAIAHHQAGRLDQAEPLYRQLLAASPDHAKAHHLLGAVLVTKGRPQDGVGLLGRAADLDPSQPDYRYSHGVVLQMLGDANGAAAAYEATLRVAPSHASAHNNLGVLHQAVGRYDVAVQHFREVARLAPDLAAGHFNLANALDELGDHQGTIAALRRAIELEPNRIEFHYNLATTLRHIGDLEGARAGYERARQLDPTHLTTMAQLALVRLQLCDWRGIERLRDELVRPALATAGERASTPFVFLVLPIEIGSDELRTLSANYGAKRGARPGQRLPAPAVRSRERLRIGYVSADFRNHATAHLIRSLFARHDRAAVEVIGYSLGLASPNSLYRQEIERGCDRFVDLGFAADEAAARRIHADGIDIVVDLKGHTQDNRMGLFAYRPAPVQATWLGYPGSTGVDFFDYAIVDKIVAPPADQPFFSEKLVWMPESYQVNDDTQAIAAEAPTRAQCGLPEQGFVFCSFNAAYKVEPAIFSVWMRILAQVPESVLWLFPGSAPTQDHLRREAQSRGIDPQRLVFAPHLRKDQHLARHRHADLFLDTYFCNAHTTASDALWAGVPLLTCPGPTFARRVAASLLSALDLPDLITPDLAAYERLAVSLARDPAALASVRARLTANRTTAPLFDTTRFARHLETAYRMMWDLYERGAPPQAFAVPPLPRGELP